MINARVMTEVGTRKFEDYINALKAGQAVVKPDLNSPPYSDPLHPPLNVHEGGEKGIFHTKLEIARYIDEAVRKAGLGYSDVRPLGGLWTWLAYNWFESLCKEKEGVLIPRALPRYIYNDSPKRYYRHLIAGPYDILHSYDACGEDVLHMLLDSPPWRHSELVEQVASRLAVTSKSVVVALQRLYWDSDARRLRVGALGKNSGRATVRDFGRVLNQLSLTYSLDIMSPEGVLNILPRPFHEWLEA